MWSSRTCVRACLFSAHISAEVVKRCHRAAWLHRDCASGRSDPDDRANDRQARDREVDRLIAAVYAARTRRAAVVLNRDGDYERARDALRATARKIRGYAGKDPELRRIVDELSAESEQFYRIMAERTRKQHYAMSSHRLRSRDIEGKAQRRMA